uniref:Homocitrate synthase, omega subunit n=1 Tax=Clostridium pasteurianum TaxID=1501 RepID=NIFVO_CLOPA|nr:RecName: Full=Homocitrate synthase, omega subunit [Clostridium pasteurianum]AAT37649.1 homocitrate synthase [Clostridium pasteurianum]
MAVVMDGVKKNIIDRTIPNLVKKFQNFNNDDIAYFLKLLHETGIDLFEINRDSMDKIKKFPLNLDYIYRIENIEDYNYLNNYNFKYIILNYKTIYRFLLEDEKIQKNLKEHNIILEIDIEDLDELYLSEDNKIFCIFNIVCLRINNLSKLDFIDEDFRIKDLKSKFNVLVDFCASNKYNMATAIIINAFLNGSDIITTEFNSNDYAAMEEVIIALKSIRNIEIRGDLKLISKLTRIYEKITSERVYSMKPILGEDIFKYESGIHADGIAKNPKNYEPFNPELIGTNRKLYIGKHSGKAALVVKFKELNLNCNNIDMNLFLQDIREKSIQEKRNVLDNEIIEMYKEYNKSYQR